MAEVLQARADQTPDALAFCFLIDGEEEGPQVTYGDLDRQARALAVALRDAAGPGDRALLLYAPGLEFIAAFFGCQYAGVVPVPAYPPRFDRPALGWQALAGIAADCRPAVVLTGGPVAPFIAGGVGRVPSLAAARVILTDGIDASAAARFRPLPTDPDALALLQYTSGSTAEPKGVMVTHRSLMHNERLIHTAFEHCGPGMGVCWLPTYHDMGLIGGVLQVVYHGAACMLMSPLILLRWPGRWLRAISKYGADTSGGPNFAYDFCVQRVPPEERTGLDLKKWSVAAVGSEPISPRTLEQFAAAFEPYGFRPEAFYPCYGLAEATLYVTGGPKGRRPVVRTVDATALEQGRAEPSDAGRVACPPLCVRMEGTSMPTQSRGHATRLLVGCGRQWPGQEVRIVDPESAMLRPDGRVGEIWVAGPSVAAGYWGRPEETERAFRARLADTGGGPFLRTGDLGFVQDGELFLTGRIKEVILIRGRNHYPHDIENTVQAVHPGLRPACGAAFEVTSADRPRVVVVQEVDRSCRKLDVARVVGDIRQAVAEGHDLQVHDVRLLEYGSLPKTSSGKVQRHLCRAGYERGTLRPWKGARP
jgi:acyl-CoA synthetase (AMP-forming)/AMP-acid ligase II